MHSLKLRSSFDFEMPKLNLHLIFQTRSRPKRKFLSNSSCISPTFTSRRLPYDPRKLQNPASSRATRCIRYLSSAAHTLCIDSAAKNASLDYQTPTAIEDVSFFGSYSRKRVTHVSFGWRKLSPCECRIIICDVKDSWSSETSLANAKTSG